MPRFGSRTIAVVRRAGGEMLTDTCNLYVKSGAQGSMGEPLHNLELVASGVRCRVIRAKVPNTSGQAIVGSQESYVETYRLECPYSTTFRVDMVAVVNSTDTYRVVNVEDKKTDSVFASAAITRVQT